MNDISESCKILLRPPLTTNDVESFYKNHVYKMNFSKKLYTYLKDSEIFDTFLVPNFDQFIENRSFQMIFVGMLNYELIENAPIEKALSKQDFSQQIRFLELFSQINFVTELKNLERIEFFHLYINLILNSDKKFIKDFVLRKLGFIRWNDLSKLYLKNTFQKYPSLIEDYQELQSKEITKNPNWEQKNLVFDCIQYINTLLPTLFVQENEGDKIVYKIKNDVQDDTFLNHMNSIEKTQEFLITILSIRFTRINAFMIVSDNLFVLKIKLFLKLVKRDKRCYEKLKNFRHLLNDVKYYLNFEIFGSESWMVSNKNLLVHYDTLKQMQQIFYTHMGDKLEHFAIKTVGKIDSREKLKEIFSYQNIKDLKFLANKLNFFLGDLTNEHKSDEVYKFLNNFYNDKEIIEEIQIYHLKAKKSIYEKIKELPFFPNENDIWLYNNKIFDFVDNNSTYYSKLHEKRQEGLYGYSRFVDSEKEKKSAAVPDLQEATTVQKSDKNTYKNTEINKFHSKESFALPKITIQFISIEDYFMRHYILWKILFAIDTREKVEDAVQRANPQFDPFTGKLHSFNGWSRMSVEVRNFSIHEVSRNKLGTTHPEKILAESTYSIVDLNSTLKKEWESLREHDIVFLLSFQKEIEKSHAQTPESEAKKTSNKKQIEDLRNQRATEINKQNQERGLSTGKSENSGSLIMQNNSISSKNIEENLNKTNLISGDPKNIRSKEDFMKEYGLKAIRGAEIKIHYDEERIKIVDENYAKNMSRKRLNAKGFSRHLVCELDPIQYAMDYGQNKVDKKSENFSDIRMMVRRKGKDTNFKAFISTIIKFFENTNWNFPDWLKNVIVGNEWAKDMIANEILAVEKHISKKGKLNLYNMFESEEHYKESFLKNEEIPETQLNYFEQNWDAQYNQKQIVSPLRFTKQQVSAIIKSLNPGMQLIVGPPGTGKTDVCVEIARQLLQNYPSEKIIIITHSNAALNDIFEKIYNSGVISQEEIVRLGSGEKHLNLNADFSKNGRINHLLEKRIQYLAEVKKITKDIGLDMDTEFTCETAEVFFISQIQSRWDDFISNLKQGKYSANLDKIEKHFPFSAYIKRRKSDQSWQMFPDRDIPNIETMANYYYKFLTETFQVLRDCRFQELIRSHKRRCDYLVNQFVRIVAMTSTHSILKHEEFLSANFHAGTIIVEEAGQLLDFETIAATTYTKYLKRMILLGDDNQLPPIVKNKLFQNMVNLQQSLFVRLLKLGYPCVTQKDQGRTRPEILELFKWKYEKLESLPHIMTEEVFQVPNRGFLHNYQLINVNSQEYSPSPYFYQNLEEAEYAVSLYMYMIMKGVSPDKITIQSTYNGQKNLIKEILNKKCSWHKKFGKPKKVTTVDRYQGQQNDFVIISLVRTKNYGFIKDQRRFVVAMSRARLGLYVLGNLKLWGNCKDIQSAMHLFKQRPTESLQIIPQETAPQCYLRKVGENTLEGTKLLNIHSYKEFYKVIEGLVSVELKEAKIQEENPRSDIVSEFRPEVRHQNFNL